MGQYNPHAPEVLGLEWVGIRDEDVTFSPAVNVVELGYEFNNTASRTLVDGRFYTRGLPPGTSDNQAYMLNLYPAGTEDQTGPIRRCIIPVNSVAVTGTFDVTPTVPILSGVTNGFAQVIVNATTAQKSMALFFAVNQFAQELNGKRIVSVNLLHQLAWNPVNANSLETAERFGELAVNSNLRWLTGGTTSFTSVQFAPETYFQLDGANTMGIPRLLALGDDVVQEGTFGDARISRIRLGDVNWFWSTPTTPAVKEVMPWRYDELKRFEVSAGTNRYWIQYDFGGSTRWLGEFWFGYAALEVLYCEEKRIVAGGVDPTFSVAGTGGTMAHYDFRTQVAALRDLPTLSANPVLNPGDYSVTVNACDVGDRTGTFAAPSSKPAVENVYPELNGIRELDDIVTHHGVRVNVTQTEGEVFTAEQTDVLMQLSLHESAATVPNVHGYGQIARAQVYGNVVARQDILSSAVPTAVTGTYTQARYYARRFADTVTPLRLVDAADATRFTIITPNDFDELDAILDGWKEVTLRLSTPIVLHSTSANPTFEWQSTLETAGNRWEVLGLTAPAISGLPGQTFQQVMPVAHRLGTTTYGGTTAVADWMPQYAPPVSGTSAEDTTDIILLLSQDPPTITGLAVSGLSQELTAYTECDKPTCCVPSHLAYNRVTWGSTPSVVATFSDPITGTWGETDTGQAWTHTENADFSVEDGVGRVALASTANHWAFLVGTSFSTFDLFATVRAPLIVGDTLDIRFAARYDSSLGNGYFFRISFDDDETIDVEIVRVDAGVPTVLSGATGVMSGYTAEQRIHIHARGVGSSLRMSVWTDVQGPPTAWTLSATSATYTTGEVAILATKAVGNTNVDPYLLIDDYMVNSTVTGLDFDTLGYYELQRMDTVDTDWRTIMRATNPGTASFNDYEARVGVLSSYRIRVVNALRFEGAWSAEVSRTVEEPGITLPSCGTDKRGVLIFTTNEVQDGSSNLAYAMTWEGTVDEDFSFIEANTLQVQAMFDRDYQVAFHGTERGGEAFTRTLLLANAAVANPRLADALSLRDLAWADLPYVCVRDDIGDRWLAAIIVPGLSARRNRRLYNASLTVIEVTATPSPVNP